MKSILKHFGRDESREKELAKPKFNSQNPFHSVNAFYYKKKP